MDWTQASAVEPVGPHRFHAHVDEQWTSLQGVHGGIVAALALRSVEETLTGLEPHPATTLRAATVGYVRGNSVGDLTIDVDVIRQGRAMVTSHARTVQNGKTTTVARFHHSTPWEGPTYSDAPPRPTRPSDTVRLEVSDQPAHLNNVEAHLHPTTTIFAGAERAEWLAWSRPLHESSFDTAWLTMFADYFPPAVFAQSTTPQRAVSIEYSLQIHSAEGQWALGDEYLASRIHAFHSHDGFAVEDAWIYLPDGTLLATARQTRLAG